MTAPVPPYASYVGDGTTTLFNFGFELLQAQDLTVWVTPFGQTFDPVANIVTNYEVTINPENVGGNINFDTAPTLLSFIVIRRVMLVDVPTDFSSLVPITGPNLDPVFLRISMLLQQIDITNIEALHYPENTPNLDYEQTTVPVLPDGYQWQGLNSKVIAVKNEENPDASTLRTELASEVDGADGAGMIGFYNSTSVGAPGGTKVDTFLKELATAISTLSVDPIGTVKMYMCAVPNNYIALNDTAIGDASSGAFYANAKYQALFEVIWSQFDSSYVNIYDSSGLPTTRGLSAAADFAAHKRLELPKTTGRSPVNANSTSPVAAIQKFTVVSGDIYPEQASGDPTERYQAGQPVKFETFGSLPSPLNTTDVFYVTPTSGTVLKVATTIEKSSSGVYVTLTGGSGDSYIISNTQEDLRVPGSYKGSSGFVQLASSVGSHFHNVLNPNGNPIKRPLIYGTGGGGIGALDTGTLGDDELITATFNIPEEIVLTTPLAFYTTFAIKYQ